MIGIKKAVGGKPKRAAHESGDWETRYQDLYENAPDMYLSVDSATGRVIRCNRTFLKATGHARNEVIGRPVFELYQPESQPLARQALKQFIATGGLQNLELVLKRRDGSPLPISLNSTAVRDKRGRILHSRSILRNVTELKRVEAALRQSEERFRAIADFSPDIISIFDREGRLVFNSAAAEKIHGYRAVELENRSTFDFIHPEDRPEVTAAFGRLFKVPDEMARVQYRYRNADGSYKWMEAFGRNEFANPNINGIIAISRDISERKRVELALQQAHSEMERRVLERTAKLSRINLALHSEMMFSKSIITTAQTIILILDRNARIVRFNPYLEQLSGYPLAEVRGKNWFKIFLPKMDWKRIGKLFKKALAGGCTRGNINSIRAKDGTLRQIEWHDAPLKNAKGRITGLVAIGQDITERVQLEQEVLTISEHERRRIAQDLHDGLGQLLVGAGFLTETLRKDMAKKTKLLVPRLNRIQGAINEAINETRNLARGVQPVAPEPNGLMSALTKLAKQTSETFRIHCDFACHPPVLLTDSQTATHLFRMAQESVTNAIKHGKAKRLSIHLTRTPKRIILTVKDNGSGMKNWRREKPGMGLRIMRYRAGIIGGRLTIRNGAAGGVTVVCGVPIPNGKDR